jgi:hypothetical protein
MLRCREDKKKADWQLMLLLKVLGESSMQVEKVSEWLDFL